MDYCLLSFFCKFSIQTHESWRIHVLDSVCFGVPVVNRLKLALAIHHHYAGHFSIIAIWDAMVKCAYGWIQAGNDMECCCTLRSLTHLMAVPLVILYYTTFPGSQTYTQRLYT